MFVAPNWIGLGGHGASGVVNPGFWVLGAGLELGYLLTLATNSTLSALVASKRARRRRRSEWNDAHPAPARPARTDEDRGRYAALAERCRSIIDLQTTVRATHRAESKRRRTASADSRGCSCACWWRAARSVRCSATARTSSGLAAARGARTTGADESGPAELRRSLEGQIDILGSGSNSAPSRKKLAYIDAEIARIEQQVELIREQAALSTDPEMLSRRIDEITATLGGTGQWIRDQQQVYGAMEDLLTEPPPLTPDARAKESQ